MRSIGIIGAGKVGCALAIGLVKKGYAIKGLYSRNFNSQQYLANRLGLNVPNDIYAAVSESDVIFLTVPDGEIGNTAGMVAESFDANGRILNGRKLNGEMLAGKVFFHCSGALSSEELQVLKQAGAHTGSLHPLQSFADREEGWKALPGIYYGLEGDEECRVAADEIIKALEGKLMAVDRRDKALYHAAACIISNYCVALADIAGGIFRQVTGEGETGEEALMPLLTRTVENIARCGAVGALTGPISRGDIYTVQRHLDELESKLPGLVEMYRIMGIHTFNLAEKKGGIDRQKSERLKSLLFNKEQQNAK